MESAPGDEDTMSERHKPVLVVDTRFTRSLVVLCMALKPLFHSHPAASFRHGPKRLSRVVLRSLEWVSQYLQAGHKSLIN